MIEETLKTTGELIVTLYSENGVVKEKKKVNNLVVASGQNHIASRLVTSGLPTAMSHMAIGDSDQAVVTGDTTLVSELGRASLVTITDSDNTVTFSATFNPGVGTGAVKEAGVFNNSTAGTLLCRTVFGEVNKLVGDTLSIDWTITIA